MQKINIEGEKKMVGTGIRDSSIVWRWRGKREREEKKRRKEKKDRKENFRSDLFFPPREIGVPVSFHFDESKKEGRRTRNIYIYISTISLEEKKEREINEGVKRFDKLRSEGEKKKKKNCARSSPSEGRLVCRIVAR